MSRVDDLYETGAGQFRRGDYLAAEHTFRLLLEAVPVTEAKSYGRAAHSLALTLEKQGRTAEAVGLLHAAIHADPSLQRARDLLARLEGGVGQRPQQPPPYQAPPTQPELPKPRTGGGRVGVARKVRLSTERDPMFGGTIHTLRFRVDSQNGQSTIVITGQRINGTVEDGDLVEIPGDWRPGDRRQRVLNLTTHEVVSAGKSSNRFAWAVVAALVVGFVAFVIWGFNQIQGVPGP